MSSASFSRTLYALYTQIKPANMLACVCSGWSVVVWMKDCFESKSSNCPRLVSLIWVGQFIHSPYE
jgi:hypothetical protein